jgi:DNA invertase Pin-like site-specific DNA recombinase
MTETTKVVGYVRVSTNKQDLSFEAQQERLKAIAVLKGLTCPSP